MAGIEWLDACDEERDDYTGEYDDLPEYDDDGAPDYHAAKSYIWRKDSSGKERLYLPGVGFIGND